MLLKNWIELKRGRAGALAVYLKVPPSFVSMMASGEKPIPVAHMADIEAFTEKEVTRQEMCPVGWQRIWPELLAEQGAQLARHIVEDEAAAPLTTDPDLGAALSQAEQAGLVLLPKKTQPWDGVERRKSQIERRADDRPDGSPAIAGG